MHLHMPVAIREPLYGGSWEHVLVDRQPVGIPWLRGLRPGASVLSIWLHFANVSKMHRISLSACPPSSPLAAFWSPAMVSFAITRARAMNSAGDSPTDESWQLGFRSIYSPALAVYHFHLVDGTSIATEMYIPWSLQAQRAGYRAFVSSVPEPGMGAMMALGLLVAGVHSRRRRERSGRAWYLPLENRGIPLV